MHRLFLSQNFRLSQRVSRQCEHKSTYTLNSYAPLSALCLIKYFAPLLYKKYGYFFDIQTCPTVRSNQLFIY